MIEFSGVKKRFGDLDVLRGVDGRVEKGEVVALIGPSGSGKSTLLRCLNYLCPFDDGKVVLGDVELRPGLDERRDAAHLRRARLRAGMVFQQFNLFPHLTVLGNVIEAPVHVKGLPRAEAEQKALRLLERVGLLEKADARPAELSGGQQQRVAIARALCMEPDALLLDEPTSALDPQLVGEVLNVLTGLASEGQTMIIVTHEMRFARQVANHVWVFDQGYIVERGTAEQVFERPAEARTKDFLAHLA
ncbi:MAG: amino acid ABC transporter ATP-binding protein [Planctomycetes bacterium]|nr:amino acid ABC transporter ATP-binding protein [Planctomycetota bacterium]